MSANFGTSSSKRSGARRQRTERPATHDASPASVRHPLCSARTGRPNRTNPHTGLEATDRPRNDGQPRAHQTPARPERPARLYAPNPRGRPDERTEPSRLRRRQPQDRDHRQLPLRPGPPVFGVNYFAGRVASFEDVTRHPQNDRTRCLGRIASRRHRRAEIRPPGGLPLDRKHAAARGVLRSRVRQSAASRESSSTAGVPPFKAGLKAIVAIGAAGRAVCHPWMRHMRARRSVPHAGS